LDGSIEAADGLNNKKVTLEGRKADSALERVVVMSIGGGEGRGEERWGWG